MCHFLMSMDHWVTRMTTLLVGRAAFVKFTALPHLDEVLGSRASQRCATVRTGSTHISHKDEQQG
jgi:hypothetical protein